FGRSLVLHSFTNTHQHKPSGFLSNTKSTGDLVGTDTVFAVGNHPCRTEPLPQIDRGILKDRADLSGELLPAFGSTALPDTAGLEEHGFLGLAVGTLDTLRPATLSEVLQRVVFVVEENHRISQCFRGIHEQS